MPHSYILKSFHTKHSHTAKADTNCVRIVLGTAFFSSQSQSKMGAIDFKGVVCHSTQNLLISRVEFFYQCSIFSIRRGFIHVTYTRVSYGAGDTREQRNKIE